MPDRLPKRQSSTSSSRRTSIDRPNHPLTSSSFSNPDIFSDEFALEPLNVTDGFRPSPSTHDDIPRTPSPTPRFSRRTSNNYQPRQDDTKHVPRRTGSSHLHGRGTSFTLRHDGPTSRIPRRTPSVVSVTSDATTYGQRPTSALSNSTILRPQSLFQGATGPSHPYAMYPQDIALARSPSIASTSTIRPRERSYMGANGPTHPYGMYSQNAAHDGEVSPIEATDSHIPVGFPGLGQPYRRRLAPDGEDVDDIVGPDGHAETLPPYTRYPDHLPHKEQTLAFGAVVENGLSSGPLRSVDTDLSRIDSVPSNDSTQRINIVSAEPAEQADESGSRKERWREIRKRRCCCLTLPKWALILIIFLAVSLAAVLGGVIGHGIRHKHEDNTSRPPPAEESASIPLSTTTSIIVVATVTTTVVDATPLSSTPTNLPPLPTGSFGVPIGNPSSSSGSCLTIANQQNAWGCASRAYLSLQVIYSDYSPTQVSLMADYLPRKSIVYGPQPPSLNGPSSITLMIDKEDVSRGPAYFFQRSYDKIVVLQNNQLSVPSKRGLAISSDMNFEARDSARGFLDQVALPGDQPWFCYWNNTVLEGFIYATENTTFASVNITGSSSASTTPPTAASSSPSSPSSTPVSNNAQQPPWFPPYPRVIKIEERRIMQTTELPYCALMQVLDDGTVNPVPNSSGDPIIINLAETEPPIQNSVHLGPKRRDIELNGLFSSEGDGLIKRQFESACHCEWLSA